MKKIAPLVNLILYGNFWISLGAVSLVWQTEWLLTGDFRWISAISVLVFSATLFTYGVHRLFGIGKVKIETIEGRFQIIERYKTHIWIYTIAGGIISLLTFFYLDWNTKIILFIPGIFSLAYVFPFFGEGKRLRDFHWVKIFFVAFVWAWVGVILPAQCLGETLFAPKTAFIFFEKLFFIFAITLPFDIRDIPIEKHSGIKTIPLILGSRKTIWLAEGLLFLALLCLFGANFFDCISFSTSFYLSGFYILTGLAVYFSEFQKHDYYFSGLLDGLIILQWLIVWVAN